MHPHNKIWLLGLILSKHLKHQHHSGFSTRSALIRAGADKRCPDCMCTEEESDNTDHIPTVGRINKTKSNISHRVILTGPVLRSDGKLRCVRSRAPWTGLFRQKWYLHLLLGLAGGRGCWLVMGTGSGGSVSPFQAKPCQSLLLKTSATIRLHRIFHAAQPEFWIRTAEMETLW